MLPIALAQNINHCLSLYAQENQMIIGNKIINKSPCILTEYLRIRLIDHINVYIKHL